MDSSVSSKLGGLNEGLAAYQTPAQYSTKATGDGNRCTSICLARSPISRNSHLRTLVNTKVDSSPNCISCKMKPGSCPQAQHAMPPNDLLDGIPAADATSFLWRDLADSRATRDVFGSHQDGCLRSVLD
jgi:hypothetical protein